jgi:hypothetical protein
MVINSWINFKDGKPAFLHPPPSQRRWLINISKSTVMQNSLTYLSERLVKTVGTAVTLMESKMTGGLLEFSGVTYHSCHFE